MTEKTKPARTRDEVLAELLAFPGVSVSDDQDFGESQEEQAGDCDACLAESAACMDAQMALDLAEADGTDEVISSLANIVMTLSRQLGLPLTSAAAHGIWFASEA